MATFQLFFQSGRAKDLSAPLYTSVGNADLTSVDKILTLGGKLFVLSSLTLKDF